MFLKANSFNTSTFCSVRHELNNDISSCPLSGSNMHHLTSSSWVLQPIEEPCCWFALSAKMILLMLHTNINVPGESKPLDLDNSSFLCQRLQDKLCLLTLQPHGGASLDYSPFSLIHAHRGTVAFSDITVFPPELRPPPAVCCLSTFTADKHTNTQTHKHTRIFTAFLFFFFD